MADARLLQSHPVLMFDPKRPCQIVHPSEEFPIGAVIFPLADGGWKSLLYCEENKLMAHCWPTQPK